MPHLPPAHHETSKHDSAHETKIKVKQLKCPEIKFRPRQVNDSSQSGAMRNFNKVEFSDAISGKFTRLRFSDINNPRLRFLHRWMSFTLFPMVELCSIATPELKCLFFMVNRIKYTPVTDIVDYFKNVHKMLGPIECTSMLTRIGMNLGCPEMANLTYIEGACTYSWS
jgi:hypothetical protein